LTKFFNKKFLFFQTPEQRNALLVFTTSRQLESLQLLNLTFKAISGPEDHRILKLNAKVFFFILIKFFKFNF